MRTWLQNYAGYLPNAATITLDGTAELFDINGEKRGQVPYTPPAAVVGTSGLAYAGPTGVATSWHTGLYVGGREVVGRTYIVPTATNTYQADGTIGVTPLALFVSAAAAFVASGSPQLIVWHQPTEKHPETGFLEIPVATASVTDKAAILRSRRD